MSEQNVHGHAVHPEPRPVLGRLPKYAAGKPAAPVPGLTSYKLSSNENPFPPLPEVLQAAHDAVALDRYPDPLATALRNELAECLEVLAEDIVTGGGSLGALIQVLSAYAGTNDDGEADEVIYPWRSFEAYPIVVETAGARSVQVPLLADQRHDLDAMAAAVTQNTSVIILCTPNNPTGPVLRTDEVEAFIAKVPSNVLIVIDEAYQEFVRVEDAVDGIEMYRKHPNVVALRTFSKAHGLANLRVGYTVAKPEITQHLRVTAVPFAVSTVAEAAAVASLRATDAVMGRVEELVEERERVVAALAGQGWKLPESQGNFVWLALGERAAEFAARASERALAVRAFAGEGVRVSIGEVEGNDRFIALAGDWLAEQD